VARTQYWTAVKSLGRDPFTGQIKGFEDLFTMQVRRQRNFSADRAPAGIGELQRRSFDEGPVIPRESLVYFRVRLREVIRDWLSVQRFSYARGPDGRIWLMDGYSIDERRRFVIVAAAYYNPTI